MSRDMTFPDCLVLKIEEHEHNGEKGKNEAYEHRTNIFVLYDQSQERFILRGLSLENNYVSKALPYSFMADTASDLADFISFALDKHNKWSYILYNYDNLPETSEEITYDFLASCVSPPAYEIAGYDKRPFSRAYLLKTLRMLRGVYNPM